MAVPPPPAGAPALAAQLDLGPQALAVLWEAGTADEVLLYLSGRDPLRLVHEPAQPGLAIDLVGPNAAGRGAFWGASGTAAGQAPSGGFFAYDARSRAGARVAAPDLPRAVVLDGGVRSAWGRRLLFWPPACELRPAGPAWTSGRSRSLRCRRLPLAGRAGPARPAAGP